MPFVSCGGLRATVLFLVTPLKSMPYYDVEYISPIGNTGTHVAVESVNKYEAARISPVMLSLGTPWSPDKWSIVSVSLAARLPAEKSKTHFFSRLSYTIKATCSKHLGNV